MTDFYTNIFTCNYEDLPPEALGHHFVTESTAMDGYTQCLKWSNTKKIQINQCAEHINSVCTRHMVQHSLVANCPFFIKIARKIVQANRGTFNEVLLFRAMITYLSKEYPEYVYDMRRIHLKYFIRHAICIERIDGINLRCIDHAKSRCEQSAVKVAQVVRMKMEDLEPIIQVNPDLHVVHYVRDPRGIASSRVSSALQWKGSTTAVREADFLCQRIREDLRQRHRLEEKFPDVFTQLTYEDLVTQPNVTAQQFYSIFHGSPPIKRWHAFVKKNMHAQNDGGLFNITVHNATAHTTGWRRNIPQKKQKVINQICADVIKELGYEL
jgi:hypothetical protein